jgi:hypothetical protein
VARYRFVTDMRFGAPIGPVYGVIVAPEGWLDDWADAVTVERTAAGGRDGVGASFEATVKAPLGYRLSAHIETVEADRPTHLRMRATGDLEGTGVWTLRETDQGTDVRFAWDVEATEPWMKRLTPVARPLFEWSHGVVMRNATEAAAASLGAELLHFRSRPVRGTAALSR